MSGRFPFRKRARLKSVPAALAGAMLVLVGVLATPEATQASETDSWTSASGIYRLTVEPTPSALRINELHSWTLKLTDAEGQPVVGARFEVSGGMPEHNHGLPTEPVVTTEHPDGIYRLEGMRFHMHGYWEVRVRVLADPGSDTVLMKLDIDPE